MQEPLEPSVTAATAQWGPRARAASAAAGEGSSSKAAASALQAAYRGEGCRPAEALSRRLGSLDTTPMAKQPNSQPVIYPVACLREKQSWWLSWMFKCADKDSAVLYETSVPTRSCTTRQFPPAKSCNICNWKGVEKLTCS